MFEHKRAHLMPMRDFMRRQARFTLISGGIIALALSIGTVGYHFVGPLPWIDAFLNAAMILAGMGPVDHMVDTRGKLFAAIYALTSGVVFLTTIGVLFAPVVHRFFHQLHVEYQEDERG